jgi:hypothetical protein
MALPEPSDLRGRDGARWQRTPRTWSLGSWGRAGEVRDGRQRGLLLELDGDWSDAMADDREAAMDHVLTAFERGRLPSAAGSGAPYRSPSAEATATRYALLPWITGGTLAPALSRARSGERMSAEVVATLGLEVALGLSATSDLGALTPSTIVIDAQGSAHVRGPLLAAVVAKMGGMAASALPYTAPETLRAGGTWGEAARSFALGAMLHDLLAGEPLFPAGAAGARAIARWEAPSVAKLPNGPSALRSALWLLLQRDPHRRGSPRAIVDLLAPLHAPSDAIASALLGGVRVPSPVLSP